MPFTPRKPYRSVNRKGRVRNGLGHNGRNVIERPGAIRSVGGVDMTVITRIENDKHNSTVGVES
jgi:hypothetical protein